MDNSIILIKNGTIVQNNRHELTDLFIENGLIKSAGTDINMELPASSVIDASGLFVLPGGIDPHVHLHLPTPAGYSCDDFYTGTRAALAGGTTTVIDFVTPNRGQSLVDALKMRKTEAQNAQCHVLFHVSPVEWRETTASEMEVCAKEWGITSFKTYLAYKNSVGISYEVLEKVMQTAKQLGAMVTVHAEEGDLIETYRTGFTNNNKLSPKYHALSRPPETEFQAVEKVIGLVQKTKCPLYFVHLSTRQSIDLVRKAKQLGLPIFAETCPQYLVLDEQVYEDEFFTSAPFVISPPIRSKEHRQALWEGLADGTIDTVGTDHCPFNLNGQKSFGFNNFTKIPNGAGGIEYRLPLLYSYGVKAGNISMEQLVNIFTTRVSHLFKINNKGLLLPGYDADLVLWDPKVSSVISRENQWQQCDSNIYEGLKIIGSVHSVYQKGKKV